MQRPLSVGARIDQGIVFCDQADEEWMFPTEFSRLANEIIATQSDLSF